MLRGSKEQFDLFWAVEYFLDKFDIFFHMVPFISRTFEPILRLIFDNILSEKKYFSFKLQNYSDNLLIDLAYYSSIFFYWFDPEPSSKD